MPAKKKTAKKTNSKTKSKGKKGGQQIRNQDRDEVDVMMLEERYGLPDDEVFPD